MKNVILLAVLFGVVSHSVAEAAVTITLGQIGDSNIDALTGSTASFGVFASSNSSDTFQGANITLDFGANDFGFPSGFSVNTDPMAPDFGIVGNPAIGGTVGITNFAAPPPPFTSKTFDGSFNIGGVTGLTLGTDQTLLFSVLVDVTAPAGTVMPVDIDLTPTSPATLTIGGGNTFSLDVNGGSLVAADLGTGFFVNPGSITVTAVPEPTSFAICGLVCAGVAARQRRKSKKSKLQTV
jgi:hypothetical protein